MNDYPIHFITEAATIHGIGKTWLARSSGLDLPVAIPTEFDGPGGAMSPEDLFGQALTNCFLATFKVFAEHSRLTFQRVGVKGQLIVDRDDQKRPVMKSFHFNIELTAPSDEPKARRLMEKALKSGFILNSVTTLITYEIAIVDH